MFVFNKNCNLSADVSKVDQHMQFILYIPSIMVHSNSGNANKYAILQSMYSLHYLAPTGCGIVAILRKLSYFAFLGVLHAGRETDTVELILPLV